MTPSDSTQRRFQFSLRRLLVFTGVSGLLLALVSREAAIYRQSTTAARSIVGLSGSVSWNDEMYENVLHDRTLFRITDVHFTNPLLAADEWQLLDELPHTFGLQVEGAVVTDATLKHLVGVEQLDYLVLYNTKVSEDAIAAFQQARPKVTVMIGYPGDADFREFRASE